MIAEGVEAIGGNAGWAGASILGGVLGWLLFLHLPAKDKMMMTLIANHEKHVEVLVQSWITAEKERREEVRAAVAAITSELTSLKAEVASLKKGGA